MHKDLTIVDAPHGRACVEYSGFVNGFQRPYEITFWFNTRAAAEQFVHAFDAVCGVTVDAK